MPLLTVGIPVYNEEKYLSQAIESVLSQTFTDFKLVISDNCSTDTSFEVALKYAALDQRVELVKHSHNIGAPQNFQYSLKKAKTKYFVWLGAHDTFIKDYFEKAIEVLEAQSSIAMVYPKVFEINSDGLTISDKAYSDIETLGLSQVEKLVKVAKNLENCSCWHGIFRTEILQSLPFEKMIGSDHLTIFAAATYGDIVELSTYGMYRRVVRDETPQETIERCQAIGCFDQDEGESPYILMCFKHLEYIFKHPKLSMDKKLALLLRIQRIFSMRFGVRWRLLALNYKKLFKEQVLG